ncbi:MAG: 50S ribosomal protein L23 [Gemmatimonadota bacterium]|nr:MAG: 50S ribosomal protein L23 [Gemmatimonadota bacterium]
MDPKKIILRPLITEKSSKMKEAENSIVFQVNRRANKIEIKQAIQKMFDVHVETVRTMNVHGKVKRMGRFEGKRPDWKKAIVTLREGETVDFLEPT